MSATHEIHPPKSPMQRVIEHLSIETAKIGKEGGYSIPEFEPAEFVSLTAGMSDPIGRELAGVIAEHYHAVNRAVQELTLWAWNRWLIEWPEKSITGKIIGQMAFAVVADYQAGNPGYTLSDVRRFLDVPEGKFTRLIPHWSAMQRRVMEGESKMVQHIISQMRGDED